MVAPVIPAINDAEIERILDAVAETGVRNAGYVLLRLPLELRDLFREWLIENFPDRYRHVIKLIRDTRGGKDYDVDIRQADDRFRPDRLDDRAPFRSCLRAARLQRDERKDHDRAFPAPASGLGAARFVLADALPAMTLRVSP